MQTALCGVMGIKDDTYPYEADGGRISWLTVYECSKQGRKQQRFVFKLKIFV